MKRYSVNPFVLKINILSIIMKVFFSILIISCYMNCYSQNRICFIDSLDKYKNEIEKMEEYNWKKIKNNPILKNFPDLIQFHFYVLKNVTNKKIKIDEYLDYSFLNKLSFTHVKRKISKFRKKNLILAETYLFTSNGKPVGQLDYYGRLLPPEWLSILNINDLGRLVADNKISFAFCGTRDIPFDDDAFNGGVGDFFCVINDSIYLLDNFHIFGQPENNGLHLIPLGELINQNDKLFHPKQNEPKAMIKWMSKDSLDNITFTNSQLKRMVNLKKAQIDNSNARGGNTYKSNQFYIRCFRQNNSIENLWIVRVYKRKRDWYLIAEGEVLKPDSNPFAMIDYINKKIIFSTHSGVIGELDLNDLK